MVLIAILGVGKFHWGKYFFDTWPMFIFFIPKYESIFYRFERNDFRDENTY